ncbi:MAG: FeoB-associated Cys-rich membrane protein [Flavobacteriales bacterium]|nr:FeoB-associated Cys-rich membrane protein [Flavobacteriales bacterium]
MYIGLQNIAVLIIFILAIWNLYKHFSNSFKGDACSSSCGACTSSKKKSPFEINIKELE